MIQRGIKTEVDRKHLEYRPNIRYEKREGSFVNSVVIPKEYDVDSNIKNIISRLPSNTTNKILMLYDDINSAIGEVEEIVIETPAQINKEEFERVSNAAEGLNIDISNGITFDIYKELYNDPHNEELNKQIILDAWEDYHSDINGDIAGEYYTELLRIKEDIDNLFDFWSRSILKNLKTDLTYNILDRESSSSELEKLEQEDIGNLLLYKKEIDETKEKLRGFIVRDVDPKNPINVEIDSLENHQRTVEKEYSGVTRKYNVAGEVGDVVKRKVNIDVYSVSSIRRRVRETPQNAYEGNLVDTLEGLLKGFLTGNFLLKLKQLRIILRYSFDKKNENMQSEKQKNDAVFNNKVKKSIQDVCARDIGLKMGVCHPLIQALGEVPYESAQSVEKIADVFLEGIQSAEHQYRDNVTQLFGAHKGGSEFGTHRVNDINDKRFIRDFYNILTIMIDHIEGGGSSPNKGSLRQWIVDLLSSASLNTIYDYSLQSKVTINL